MLVQQGFHYLEGSDSVYSVGLSEHLICAVRRVQGDCPGTYHCRCLLDNTYRTM